MPALTQFRPGLPIIGRRYGSFAGRAPSVVEPVTPADPTYTATVDALASILLRAREDDPGIGQVFVEDRYIRDKDRLQHFFGVPRVGEERDLFAGWRVHRQSIAERWLTGGRAVADEVYVLRGIRGVKKEAGSESTFQHTIDRVLQEFRDVTSLAIDGNVVISAGRTTELGYRMFAERLVHHAEIEIVVTQQYYAAAPLQGTPQHILSRASDRDKYQHVANQIAVYLSGVEGAGKVYPERRMGTSREDSVALFGVDVEQNGLDGQQIRAWDMYLETPTEERLSQNQVLANMTWRLRCWRSWIDSKLTHVPFQEHVDAVRRLFRGVGDLGDPRNPTATISRPMQVREIGGRFLASGHLVHFADCSLDIQAVLHAPRTG